MLWSIIIPPIIFFISFSIMNICDKKFGDKKKKDASKRKVKELAFALGSLICVMVLLSAITASNMIDGKSGISVLGAALTSAAVFGAVLVRRYDAPRVKAFLKKSAIFTAALLLAEVFIFNGKSFASLNVNEAIPASDMSLGTSAQAIEAKIIVSSDTDIVINDPVEDANVLRSALMLTAAILRRLM